MSPLHRLLHGFAGALLDASASPPRGLTHSDGRTSARRFNVYRNNVVVGLTDALAANYPAVCRIVGTEFFSAMARVHIGMHPPRSPMLFDYGQGFADFIAQFGPADCVPYLADVARLERAWLESYHAVEVPALRIEGLQALKPDDLSRLGMTAHPSLRVVNSTHPIVTIWAMNTGDGGPGPLPDRGESALIVRPLVQVQVVRIDKGTARFVGALSNGASLLDAARTSLAQSAGFDLTECLQLLLSAGAFAGVAPILDISPAHLASRTA